jgi:hypothetical protein
LRQLTPGSPVAIKPSSSCKIFVQMRENPRANWTIADVATLCEQLGMELRKPTSGSHFKVVRNGGYPLTIPARRPIKPIYIRALVGWALEHCREADEGVAE